MGSRPKNPRYLCCCLCEIKKKANHIRDCKPIGARISSRKKE